MPVYVLWIFEGICLTWCGVMGIYVLIKRRKNIKKAKKDLEEYEQSKQKQSEDK